MGNNQTTLLNPVNNSFSYTHVIVAKANTSLSFFVSENMVNYRKMVHPPCM